MSKASSGTGRIIDCPACGQTIEDLWDDNEGLREGERIECPLCEAILTVEAVHVEMHLRLSTTAPPAGMSTDLVRAYQTAGCGHCWWYEGGRCYEGNPKRGENGRSEVLAEKRCDKFWGKRAALTTVIPTEKLLILSEHSLHGGSNTPPASGEEG